MPKTKGLTDKQAAFVQEYLIDFNATQAAIRAGYSENSAQQQSSDLLLKPLIQEEINQGRAERAKRTKVTQDMVVEELAKVAFTNTDDFMKLTSDGEPYIDLSEMSRDQKAALSSFTIEDYTDGRGEDARQVKRVKVDSHNKLTALQMLGKFTGGFADKLDVQGDISINVNTGMEATPGSGAG